MLPPNYTFRRPRPAGSFLDGFIFGKRLRFRTPCIPLFSLCINYRRYGETERVYNLPQSGLYKERIKSSCCEAQGTVDTNNNGEFLIKTILLSSSASKGERDGEIMFYRNSTFQFFSPLVRLLLSSLFFLPFSKQLSRWSYYRDAIGRYNFITSTSFLLLLRLGAREGESLSLK